MDNELQMATRKKAPRVYGLCEIIEMGLFSFYIIFTQWLKIQQSDSDAIWVVIAN